MEIDISALEHLSADTPEGEHIQTDCGITCGPTCTYVTVTVLTTA